MTRIAAGHPAIWPDICVANRDAILGALDSYRGALDAVRMLVDAGDGEGLLDVLERGRRARRNLPSVARVRGPLAELRVPVADRPGVISEVSAMALQLGVNIVDIEIAHSIEGDGGVLVLVVPTEGVGDFETALTDRSYHVSRTDLS